VITYRWETPYVLADNEAFEVVFWRSGGNPMQEGRGWGGTTRNGSITINWDNIDAAPDAYEWGVLLVNANPYKRLHYMGGGNRFQYTGPN
jgi:hypothetical protein